MDCFVEGTEIPPIEDVGAYLGGSELADYSHRYDQAQKTLEKQVVSLFQVKDQVFSDVEVDALLVQLQALNEMTVNVVEEEEDGSDGSSDDGSSDGEKNGDNSGGHSSEYNGEYVGEYGYFDSWTTITCSSIHKLLLMNC